MLPEYSPDGAGKDNIKLQKLMTNTFQQEILAGIPSELPAPKPYDTAINHAPKRKDILNAEEKVLAVQNALRYFPQKHHEVLAAEFAAALKEYGRLYK